MVDNKCQFQQIQNKSKLPKKHGKLEPNRFSDTIEKNPATIQCAWPHASKPAPRRYFSAVLQASVHPIGTFFCRIAVWVVKTLGFLSIVQNDFGTGFLIFLQSRSMENRGAQTSRRGQRRVVKVGCGNGCRLGLDRVGCLFHSKSLIFRASEKKSTLQNCRGVWNFLRCV